jgi:hypothetical protein
MQYKTSHDSGREDSARGPHLARPRPSRWYRLDSVGGHATSRATSSLCSFGCPAGASGFGLAIQHQLLAGRRGSVLHSSTPDDAVDEVDDPC